MCDTVVALGSTTADGATLFGKNSDREPNEPHYVESLPAADYPPGVEVKCTYIAIPQVAHTFALLLARPSWIWGAEMGANEHGLAIGNEAVFTKVPYEKGPALIGMDFVRLALERSRTAGEALKVMTDLLERYGQGGNCGYRHKTYYHNSFLIVDPDSAWVLETAGRQWAAEQVKDVRSISNGITIGSRWDLASGDLVAYAVDRGWCKGRDDFHFARSYSDSLYTGFSRCNERQCRTAEALSGERGKITVHTVMRVLRDHGARREADWSPARGVRAFSVCAHAGFGPIRATGTTGSMVSHLARGVQTHFVTGTAAPCTSVFKPVWVDAGIPDTGPLPGKTYDKACLFWRHESLHRAVLRDYQTRLGVFSSERDALERRFLREALEKSREARRDRSQCSADCFREAAEAERGWEEKAIAVKPRGGNGWLYDWAWRGWNREACLRVR